MRAMLALLLVLGGCERNADPGFMPAVVPGQHCADDGAIGAADDGCNTCACHGNLWKCTNKRCSGVCQPAATKQVSCSVCRCSAAGVWQCDRSACLGVAGPG